MIEKGTLTNGYKRPKDSIVRLDFSERKNLLRTTPLNGYFKNVTMTW